VERAIVMTGIGGQGIQLVAKLLAQAAIREEKQVMMFGLFMGTIRGGSSESTVVIADREIVTPPIVPSAWAVLAMHPEGLPAIGRKAERGGVLVFNSTLVHAPPAWDGVRHIPVLATEMATTGVTAVLSLFAAPSDSSLGARPISEESRTTDSGLSTAHRKSLVGPGLWYEGRSKEHAKWRRKNHGLAATFTLR